MTKKEFNILFIVLFVILFAVSIATFIVVTNYRNEQKITPEIRAELNRWSQIAEATRRLIKDEPLWTDCEKEATLIATTITPDMEYSVDAVYMAKKGAIKTYVYGGNTPAIKNKAVRETLCKKLTHCLAASSAANQLRENEIEFRLSGVELKYEDKEGGAHHLIDANIDGVWDNQPSD